MGTDRFVVLTGGPGSGKTTLVERPGWSSSTAACPTSPAYAQLGRPVPAHVTRAVARCRYASPVFVAPPWPEIYVHDEERRHPWASAVRTYEVMVEAYTAAGYDLVELPRVPVGERVAFVLERVA